MKGVGARDGAIDPLTEAGREQDWKAMYFLFFTGKIELDCFETVKFYLHRDECLPFSAAWLPGF